MYTFCTVYAQIYPFFLRILSKCFFHIFRKFKCKIIHWYWPHSSPACWLWPQTCVRMLSIRWILLDYAEENKKNQINENTVHDLRRTRFEQKREAISVELTIKKNWFSIIFWSKIPSHAAVTCFVARGTGTACSERRWGRPLCRHEVTISRVKRSSDASALTCCKAGPSSNLGSAPHGGSAHWPIAMKICRWASANVLSKWLYECMYCKKKNK